MFLVDLSFEVLTADSSILIYYKEQILIAIYVDDLLIAGLNRANIDYIKVALSKRFLTKDRSLYNFYLGVLIFRNRANRILRLG